MEDRDFQLPQDQTQYILAKREKIKDQSFLEKAGDFLFTLGNEVFKEYYYIIDCIQNIVYEKIYINEYNASAFRGIQEFDHKELYTKQILLFAKIKKVLSQHGSISKDDIINELEQFIGKENGKQTQMVSQGLQQLAKQACLGGVASVQAIKITTQQTFRIVNNALVKEGIKGFMSIGGKQFLKEGAKVAVTQAGNTLLTGTVTNVTNSTVSIGQTVAKNGFSSLGLLKGLGIGLVINAVVGGIKSATNTKWIKENKFVCICDQDFNFEIIKDFDNFNKKLEEDLKKYEQLKQSIQQFDIDLQEQQDIEQQNTNTQISYNQRNSQSETYYLKKEQEIKQQNINAQITYNQWSRQSETNYSDYSTACSEYSTNCSDYSTIKESKITKK